MATSGTQGASVPKAMATPASSKLANGHMNDARLVPRSRTGCPTSITMCCGCTEATRPMSAMAATSACERPSTCSMEFAPCLGMP